MNSRKTSLLVAIVAITASSTVLVPQGNTNFQFTFDNQTSDGSLSNFNNSPVNTITVGDVIDVTSEKNPTVLNTYFSFITNIDEQKNRKRYIKAEKSTPWGYTLVSSDSGAYVFKIKEK